MLGRGSSGVEAIGKSGNRLDGAPRGGLFPSVGRVPGNETVRTRSVSRRVGVVVAGILGVLVLVYVISAVAYLNGIDQNWEAPTPPADGVAISLVPYDIDTRAQFVTAEMVVIPGSDLLSADQRLTQDITVDVLTAESQTVTFDRGTVPSPVKVDIPAFGVVQRYPFDTYRYAIGFRTAIGPPKPRVSSPVPTQVAQVLDLAGWNYTRTEAPQMASPDGVSLTGELTRDGSIRTIAVTFILLIMMFGVLAVIAVVAGLRGRLTLAIGTAAWLTGALFALVSLRNSLPGNPPLGSVMDVLVYFWVIAAIMIAIGVTVITLVVRADDAT